MSKCKVFGHKYHTSRRKMYLQIKKTVRIIKHNNNIQFQYYLNIIIKHTATCVQSTLKKMF